MNLSVIHIALLFALILQIISGLKTLHQDHIKVVVPTPDDPSHQSTIFQVYVNEDLWFESEEIYIHFNGQYYSTANSSLQIIKQSTSHASDKLGSHEKYSLFYGIAGNEEKTVFIAHIKLYDNFIMFEQQFPFGLVNTSTTNADSLISGFPTFTVNDRSPSKGFAHWVSWYYNPTSTSHLGGIGASSVRRKALVAPGFATPVFGKWNSDTILQGGIGGTGVTAIYDENAHTTAILSAFSNTMTLSHISPQPGSLQYGIMGNISEVPSDYSISTILYISNNKGITDTMHDWGRLLRSYYNKPSADEARSKDLTLQYLGFTTDNGAYYYYHTDGNTTYEETLINVFKYAQEVQLPYRYVLLDSWWYYKGSNGGVSNWTAQPELFPHGLEYLYQQTGWSVQAHNRYWALDNVYSDQRGGDYQFVEDPVKQGAVPMDEKFWSDLLRRPSKEWGLIVYEQDWLFNEFYEYVSQMLSDVTLGHSWLQQMAKGAKDHGLTIQYCMPYVRHLLQSLEFDLVTQARASDDYVTAPYDDMSYPNPNWRIGGQSLLIDSLGMAPSKDGYWSTSYQPNNPYGEERFEPCPRLQSAVTALSAGPHAIADGIGYSDVPLILKSCRKDGRLLQPSSPATLIDAAFIESAFENGTGPQGQVWFAPSMIDGFQFGSIFAADLKSDWLVKPSDVLLSKEAKYLVRQSNQTSSDFLIDWSDSLPLHIKNCDINDFQLYSISPIFSNQWAFLGELSKWIPFSPNRFHSIKSTESGIQVMVEGSSNEEIEVSFANPSKTIITVHCTVPLNKKTSFVSISSDGHCH